MVSLIPGEGYEIPKIWRKGCCCIEYGLSDEAQIYESRKAWAGWHFSSGMLEAPVRHLWRAKSNSWKRLHVWETTTFFITSHGARYPQKFQKWHGYLF